MKAQTVVKAEPLGFAFLTGTYKAQFAPDIKPHLPGMIHTLFGPAFLHRVQVEPDPSNRSVCLLTASYR